MCCITPEGTYCLDMATGDTGHGTCFLSCSAYFVNDKSEPDGIPGTAAYSSLRWPEHKRELKVYFEAKNKIPTWRLSDELQRLIGPEIILEWANLWSSDTSSWVPKFVETDDKKNSDIRVLLTGKGSSGSWSLLGTTAASHKNGTTMVLNFSRNDDNYRQFLAVHEFGHALGLGHPHQLSCLANVLDEENTKEWLQRVCGLTPAESEEKFRADFRAYMGVSVPDIGTFDASSVMCYPIGAVCFKGGECRELSDAQFNMLTDESFANRKCPSQTDILTIHQLYKNVQLLGALEGSSEVNRVAKDLRQGLELLPPRYQQPMSSDHQPAMYVPSTHPTSIPLTHFTSGSPVVPVTPPEPPSLGELLESYGVGMSVRSKVCSNAFLAKVGPKMSKLRHMDLNLNIPGAATKDTAQQRLALLEQWKSRYAFRATYGNLVQCLWSAHRMDLINIVCLALSSSPSAIVDEETSSNPSSTSSHTATLQPPVLRDAQPNVAAFRSLLQFPEVTSSSTLLKQITVTPPSTDPLLDSPANSDILIRTVEPAQASDSARAQSLSSTTESSGSFHATTGSSGSFHAHDTACSYPSWSSSNDTESFNGIQMKGIAGPAQSFQENTSFSEHTIRDLKQQKKQLEVKVQRLQQKLTEKEQELVEKKKEAMTSTRRLDVTDDYLAHVVKECNRLTVELSHCQTEKIKATVKIQKLRAQMYEMCKEQVELQNRNYYCEKEIKRLRRQLKEFEEGHKDAECSQGVYTTK